MIEDDKMITQIGDMIVAIDKMISTYWEQVPSADRSMSFSQGMGQAYHGLKMAKKSLEDAEKEGLTVMGLTASD